jgi:hypothetical protein
MPQAVNSGDKAIREFWEKRAELRGGAVELYSFAVYLDGGDGGIPRSRTGVAYLAGGSLWFETVPANATVLGFGTGGAREGTEPFEAGIPLGDIAGVQAVYEKAAREFILGKGKKSAPRALSFLEAFFAVRVLMFSLRDGSAVFLDLAKEREFLDFFRRRSG